MPQPPLSDRLHPSWHASLLPEFDKPYMQRLREFLATERASGHVFYPPASQTFNAFLLTPLDQVSCVILGQDPYHGPGQAMGLSFSVPQGVTVPPSLKRIFKEQYDDVGVPISTSGDLTPWARDQSVMMLNAVLSVRAHRAGSHARRGWETFTDHVLSVISEQREGVAFLLWGNYARAKRALIDADRHLVLEAPHPSPLAQGFLGCKHFSQVAAYRQERGLDPIDWRLS